MTVKKIQSCRDLEIQLHSDERFSSSTVVCRCFLYEFFKAQVRYDARWMAHDRDLPRRKGQCNAQHVLNSAVRVRCHGICHIHDSGESQSWGCGYSEGWGDQAATARPFPSPFPGWIENFSALCGNKIDAGVGRHCAGPNLVHGSGSPLKGSHEDIRLRPSGWINVRLG